MNCRHRRLEKCPVLHPPATEQQKTLTREVLWLTQHPEETVPLARQLGTSLSSGDEVGASRLAPNLGRWILGLRIVIQYDDLELLKAKERGKHSRHAVLSRDSNVVDIFTEEIAERNPNINMTHVFPGIVKTDVLKNSPPPWYLSGLMTIGMALLGCAPESTVDSGTTENL
ncbi:hypothetical protein JB92DRAFT_2825054 [Gautieria morchelliformis]|nr:hypothetical protein JB92DRAFT_2825054 [Gautieria morchelliformis]